MAQPRFTPPSAGPRLVDAGVGRRLVLVAVARGLVAAALALLLYALAPVRPETAPAALVTALLGLVLLGVVFLSQLRRITRSARPLMTAVEALAFVAVLFVALFALAYGSIAAGFPGSFSQPIDKIGGIYFTMSILSTVGFGDIAAVSDGARVVVTVQMVLNVILLGTAIRLVTETTRGAVQAREARAASQAEG
jgi:voltage-gated potassium channel